METCEESIFEADLNILQYRYLTGVHYSGPKSLTYTNASYRKKKTSMQLEHSLEGPQPWSDP